MNETIATEKELLDARDAYADMEDWRSVDEIDAQLQIGRETLETEGGAKWCCERM